MDNIERIYKTSDKQREATKRYKNANKDKINAKFRDTHKEKMNDLEYKQKRRDYAKTAYNKIQEHKYDIEFVIAFIDE